MKLIRSTAVLALAILVLLSPALARGGRCDCGVPAAIADLPLQPLDGAEREALLYLREEEKLARDVYLRMADLWGLGAFNNIARAEQRHMDLLLVLLERYGVADPVGANGPGKFKDPRLQTLYEDLAAKSTGSSRDALLVGATIEDLNLRDLAADLDRTDNQDIAIALQNLRKASRNHMRTMASLLDAGGAEYESEYISEAELASIVASPKERGRLDAEGDAVGGTGCGQQRCRRHRRR